MDETPAQELEIAHKVQDFVENTIRGTDFAPPEGGMVVDVLCVMLVMDKEGQYGTSWLSVGSNHQAYGMARDVIRAMDSGVIVLAAPGQHNDDNSD